MRVGMWEEGGEEVCVRAWVRARARACACICLCEGGGDGDETYPSTPHFVYIYIYKRYIYIYNGRGLRILSHILQPTSSIIIIHHHHHQHHHHQRPPPPSPANSAAAANSKRHEKDDRALASERPPPSSSSSSSRSQVTVRSATPSRLRRCSSLRHRAFSIFNSFKKQIEERGGRIREGLQAGAHLRPCLFISFAFLSSLFSIHLFILSIHTYAWTA